MVDASMTPFWLGVIGGWLLADSIFSIMTWPKQSWWKDHSIRVVRGVIALALIAMGAVSA